MQTFRQMVKNSRVFNRFERIIHPNQSSLSGINERYDLQTVAVMRRVLKPDSNCVDIGAHRGSVLQEMLQIAPAGHHHAFEALPHLASGLRTAFPQVAVHEMAVGASVGDAEFQYVVNAPGYSGLQKRIYDRPDPQIQTIRVSTVTLDSLIPVDEAIAFIKIDIEGGEYHALQGGVETIARSLPVIVFEAGLKSTGQYGVSAEAVFALVTGTLAYSLSTMERWLAGRSGYTREEFERNWIEGPDFYFIATPRG